MPIDDCIDLEIDTVNEGDDLVTVAPRHSNDEEASPTGCTHGGNVHQILGCREDEFCNNARRSTTFV